MHHIITNIKVIGMKKIYILTLALSLSLLSISANAQMSIAQMVVMSPHYYSGEVYFVDGHHETYEELELPRVGKSKLGAKKHKSDKKRIEIEAVDILGVKMWHEKFPDNTSELYYIPAKKTMMTNPHQWGNPIAGSDWGIVFKCEMYYQIDKKNGDLNFVKFVGGTGPDTPTLYYLKRPEWNEAQLLAANYQFWGGKKKIAELFKDNSEIYEGIKSGKLKISDIQYILDEMAGGKKAEAPVESTPQVETEASTNGTVGDDE